MQHRVATADIATTAGRMVDLCARDEAQLESGVSAGRVRVGMFVKTVLLVRRRPRSV